MSRRLWIVTELYWPEETSTAYFLTGIAEGLATSLEVHVVCAMPSSQGDGRPWFEMHDGVSIHRAPSTRFSRHSLPLRMVNALSLSASVLLKLMLLLSRGDRVLVVTNPPLLPAVASLAAHLRGAERCLLVHDVYPEILAAAGVLHRETLAYRLLHAASRVLLRSFDRVVVLGRDMRQVLESKAPGLDTTIIPNWGDVEHVKPLTARQNPLRARLRIADDDFVVGYSGNMGRTHDLESILSAAREIGPGRGFHFLLIGAGAQYEAVERALAAEPAALRHVTLLPLRPRAELGSSLTAADLWLLTFKPGMAGLSVPSRMYNLLAAGRAVVAMCEAGAEPARLVEEESIGWTVAPGDVAGLTRAMLAARSNPGELIAMGRRARALAEKRYSRSAVVAAYGRLFDVEVPVLVEAGET